MYERMRALREDNDLKQSDLAKHLKCTQVCYSYYENGQRSPNLDLLMEFSNYFNVSIHYLITGKEFEK